MSLFHIELLDQRLNEIIQRIIELDAIRASDPTAWEGKPAIFYEHESAKRQKTLLKQFITMHRFVDLGVEDESIAGWTLRRYPRIKRLSGDISPYLDMDRMTEASLLPTHLAYRGEHALLTMYRADHGMLAFVHGMRYITHDIFAIADNLGNKEIEIPEYLLNNIFALPYTVGINDFTLRSFPIFRPESSMAYEELYRKMQNYVHVNLPVLNGFIRWDDPRSASISGLMVNGWWENI